jgi:D-beta-D-heptose 7-phosphate kinase/D-beta-D-heptose 1-phosphate adenosyltransferase
MAGNVCNNLAALGCNVYSVYGENSTKTRLIDIRSKQQIVRIDNDVVSTPPSIPYSLTGYNAVVISDYNKGTVTYELIENLRNTFDGPIFVDTKKTDLARLEGCIVKINSFEFSQIKTDAVT